MLRFVSTAVALLLLTVAAARGQEKRTISVTFVGPDTVPVEMTMRGYIGPGVSVDQAYLQRWVPGAFATYSPGPYQKVRTEKFTYADPEKRLKLLTVMVELAEKTRKGFTLENDPNGKLVPPPQLGDELTAYYTAHLTPTGRAYANLQTVVESAVVLDKTLKYVEVKETPPFRVPQGATERKREEYTVRHTVGVKEGTTLAADVKAGWKFVEASIRGSIERSTERTYETSKTSSREVEIRGGNKPLKLVWIETFRTGRAITIVNGQRHEIPIEFRDGWDLQSREAK